jgi:hypothetical protein
VYTYPLTFLTWYINFNKNHLSSPSVFSGVHVTRSLVLYVVFCRSLFFLLSFSLWSLCCLFFFDLRILISSNSSWASCMGHTSYVYVHLFVALCYLLQDMLPSSVYLSLQCVRNSGHKRFHLKEQVIVN